MGKTKNKKQTAKGKQERRARRFRWNRRPPLTGRRRSVSCVRRTRRGHATPSAPSVAPDGTGKMNRKEYEQEMRRLHGELVALQEWVKATGAKVCIVFEGRDTAGKGGTIRRITERVSPRVFRVVALPAPTEREKSQMYVQRYIRHFPAAGEVVIFDRSWYNRAGVEPVLGFCTPEQTRAVPGAGAGGRAGDGRVRDHPAQVLARGRPRGADPAPREPDRRPAQGLEAVRDGPEVVHPLGRLLARPRRDVPGQRHGVGARGTWPTRTTRSAAGSTSSPTCSIRSRTSHSRHHDVELPPRQRADGYTEADLQLRHIPTPF